MVVGVGGKDGGGLGLGCEGVGTGRKWTGSRLTWYLSNVFKLLEPQEELTVKLRAMSCG